jgi:cytochrome P450
MMLFPDVQRKAQAEIDKVFGKPTFPTANDRDILPYLDAVVKEALRWHTVGAFGIPHRTDEDDVVNGLLIPKNAILLPNIWYLSIPP